MRILVAIIIISISTIVNAQITDSLSVDINEVIISENRIALPFSDASRSIDIITKKQIQDIRPTSINELLQAIGGVDIRQRGANGVQADLSIRGGTFEQALVLINGVKMLDPQTGHHLMNLPITIDDIERIEILKGPGARVYGQNAFAGAINIITRPGTEQGVDLRLDLGANHLISAGASIKLPIEHYRQTLSISHDQSDGYRSNTDYIIDNIFYQAQTDIGKGTLDLFGGYTARSFGANGFYGSESFTDQYEETRTSIASASYSVRSGDWKIAPRVYWRRNTDNWQFRRQQPDFFQNFHTSHVVSGEINTSMTHAFGILGIGAEYNAIDLTSNNLGEQARSQLGFHLENRFLLMEERLDITPGIYLLQISDFGSQVFPGLDIGYRVDNNWKLFSNAGLTSRIPSFTDLYYEDRGNLGNPDLQTESAFTFELGAKYHSRNTLFQLSYFRRDASDLIDWFKVNPEDKWMPDNFGSATYNGFDLSTTIDFSKKGASSFIKSVRVNYLYLNASLGDSDFALSRNALENLKHQLIVNPIISLSEKVNFHLLYKYNDRVSLDNYGVLDANIQYSLDYFTFTIKANNLLDSEYRETNLVPMPGRWVIAGVKFRLK